MLNFKKISVLFLLFLAVMVWIGVENYLPICVYFIPVLIWFWIVMIGFFTMSWNFHLKAFTGPKRCSSKDVAITFDDGPHSQYTPKVLELLKKYDAKATFFLIGKQVQKHPELVKKIRTSGNDIGNHSFSHTPAISFGSTKTWISEIEQTDSIIEKITGVKPVVFRPPYGVTTPHLAAAIKRTGHQVIGWNVRSYDTAINDAELIKKRVINRIKPGSIILFHDTQANTVEVLEHLLLFLQQNRYKTVLIKDFLNE